MSTGGPGHVGEVPPGDAAVVAHVILNGLSVTVGRVATLRAHWDRVPPQLRDEWLAQISETAIQSSAVFQRLVRGQPVDD